MGTTMIYLHLILFNLIVLLGLTIAVPLIFGIGGGLFLGCLIALRNLKELFIEAHRVEKETEVSLQGSVTSPPAYIMYPLDRGWRVLHYSIRNLLVRSSKVAARWIDHAVS